MMLYYLRVLVALIRSASAVELKVYDVDENFTLFSTNQNLKHI